MLKTKPYTTLLAPCLASLVGLFLYDSPRQALAYQPNLQLPEQPTTAQPAARLTPPILQAQAPTPAITRRSGRRRPASARGPCLPSEKSLTALMPETNLGLTVATHPTFFFYIPQTTATSAEFVLLDEANNHKVYETTFTITGTPGIVSVSLPASKTLPPLEIGKDYHWYVSVICDPDDRSGDVYVDGWVQRVEPTPSLMSQLEKASPAERVALYRKNGIWHDTLTFLAEGRRLNPSNSALAAEWATLLRSVGLEKIAQERLNGISTQ